MAPPPLPALPRRLPLTIGELHALAGVLGVSFDPDDLPSAGPYRLGGSCDLPEVLVARHEQEGDEPVEPDGDLVDVRLFRPFDGLVRLGADFSGDGLYLDPRRRTRAGTPPVVRFCHDEALTAQLEANGLVEYAARGLLLRWAQASGHDTSPAVMALLTTPVRLPGAEDDERPPLEAVPTQRVTRRAPPPPERPPLEAEPTQRMARPPAMAKPTLPKKAAAKKAVTKKAVTKKATAKKAATKKAAPNEVATKKVATKKVATKKVATKKVATKKAPLRRATKTTKAR